MKNVCLDIGGTSIKCAVVDGDKIVRSDRVLTRAKEGRAVILDGIFAAIEKMLPFADRECGIGIGSAGDINCETGKVVFATENLPNFTGLELGKLVGEKYKKKVKVINDAQAGALAEYVYGCARGARSMVMITLGTGLGGAYISDGSQLHGDRYSAMRIGHLPLHKGGRECTCGRKGCIEQYVSATGLIRTAKEKGCDKKDANEVFEAMLKGDKNAKLTLEIFVEELAQVIEMLFLIFDPTCLVIGGGLSEIKQYWWDNLIDKIPKRAEFVKCAMLGNKAGVIGANAHLEGVENHCDKL